MENGKWKIEYFSFKMFAEFEKKLYFCNRNSENLKI